MSDRWQKIEEIFEVAVELPPDERDVYLEKECGGDAGLRLEVEQLIFADGEAEEFIEEPLLGSNTLANFLDEKVGNPEDIESSVPPHFLGRRIGAYRLITELGRGGMGAVFLAQRDDAAFKKSVAIKLIKRGMDTDFILKRFRNERQILATLDHPFIARLLDGGTTDDELPYFVMEYVEGSPIHKYCDENRLTIGERLQLFQKVCAAVNYAHQNLIIHRDLKPGNILVTKDVSPKLLDFGIAKILNPEFAADTIAPTLTGMRLMTPEYASPEQIRGDALTPASDIYSLGVLLYELLTGKRPYRFSSRAPHDIARVVCEEQPENPATVVTDENAQSAVRSENTQNTLEDLSRNRRTTPETLLKELSGNLKNILFKALRKSPENRYATAEEFAKDIQSYLDGLPITAPELDLSTEDRFEESMPPASESLAILPFRMFRWKTSKNDDPNTDDFLSIGLADALISRLSGIKSISVRPTSSVVKYASETADRENAGNSLGVSYVLDGRIQHIGNRVRVTAQLVHLRNNETMWAGQFDEEMSDILTLQDSISMQVSDALIHQLTGEEREKISKRGTNNPKAQEAFLRGRFYWHSYEVENLAKSLVCYYEAIAHDPEFALAYTGVADYFNFLSVFGLMSPEESFPAAKEAAQKAIELDDTSAEAYTSLAIAVLGYDWDLAESEKLLKKALELNPNYGEARIWHAHLLGLQNRHEESLREMKLAEKLNTVSASLLVNYAIRLRDARKFDDALVKIRQANKLTPSYNIGVQAYCWVADYVDIGEEAEHACRLAYEKNENLNLPTYAYAYVLAVNGKSEKARQLAEKLEQRKKNTYVPSTHLVLTYIALGEYDLAFKWLDKAFAERDFWAIWLPVDPRYDALKNDQRFDLYAAKIRPVADEEIHQSQIPTRIFQPEQTAESQQPQTLAEKPALHTIETAPAPKKTFSRKFALWATAAAILIGLISLGVKTGVIAFEIRDEPSKTNIAENIPPAGNLEKTLVIFPFAIDADAENEASFGDGLADAINKKLGQIERVSVRTLKQAIDDAKSAREIGAEFGANYVLRGKFHKTADRVQVTAELQNASEDKTVWLETFDESILDFPNLQSQIAEKILKVLTVELSIAERERIGKTYTTDSEAYQLYLVGRYEMRSRRPENLRKAIENFERSKEKDPKFVLAYVGLADAYALLNLYSIPPPPDAYASAKKNAVKALELDDGLAEAHASMAYILFYGEWNRTEAEKHFRRAIELNPSYSTVHHWFGLALAAMGKPDESIEQINLAMRLEPKSAVIHSAAGLVYYYARRYEEAPELCRKSLEIDSGFVPAHKTMRVIYEAAGKYTEAREAYLKERNFAGNTDESEPGWMMITAQVESVGGKKAEAEASLQKAVSSPVVKENPRGYAYEVAVAYTLAGDKENALRWIETAKNAKDHSFNFVKVDPRLDILRQAEKYRELTENIFK